MARFGDATGTALFRVIDKSPPPTEPDGDGGIEIVETHGGTVVSEAPGDGNLVELSPASPTC